jgi:hypothetical protein
MIMLPETFAGIPMNNYVDGPCSPVLDVDFLGIRIAAPETVLLDGDMVLPVCGSYRFKAGFWNRFDCLGFEMALVAVNAATHIPLITNLRYMDFVPDTGKFDETEDGFGETTAAGWFNADLCFYLPDFPKSPAAYHIFALIGGEKSNVVTLRIRKP